MKGLESLEIINNCLEELDYEHKQDTNIWRYDLEVIKADLEVLEILRKYMELTNGVSYRENFDEGVKFNLVCFGDINDLDTKEDFNKVKQWLEGNENV